MIQTAIKVAFGFKEHWLTCPITNLRSDTIRVRRKFRYDKIGMAFVKAQDGSVTAYILTPDMDALKLAFPIGANTRS